MKAQSGRPRNPRIDEAVLKAAAELVVEVGYADLTIAAIAERAGTSKPAIYRRWPSKAHLLHEAAFPAEADRLSLPDTGLMAEFAADPALHPALLERFGGVWKAFRDRIVIAAERGEVRADTDPDVLI